MQRWSKAFPAGICISALAALATPLASASLARATAPPAASPARLQVVGASALKARLTAANPALGKFDGSFLRIKAAYDAASASGSRNVDMATVNPKARVRYQSPLAAPAVLIDAIVSGDPQAAKAQLEALGFKTSAVFRNDIGGWLPVDRAADAAALSSLRFAKTAMMHTRSRANASPADPVAYQGDFVQGSLALKQATGLTGSGVTVGVISDSFDCAGQYDAANPGGTHLGDYADDVTLGALPAGVNVIKDDPVLDSTGTYCTGTDEGRALAQIVYAVAPGAKLAFYTADGSEADFALGIITLAMPTSQTNPINNLKGGGAQVIDDDVGYFDEPVYQEGEVGIAIDIVASGSVTFSSGSGSSATTSTISFPPVAYFSSAGNDATNSFETTSASFTGTAAANAPNAGEQTLLIGTDANGTKYYYLPITIPRLPPGGQIPISLFWDQPYQSGYANDPGDAFGTPGVANGPGATSVMDICIGDASGNIPTTGSLTNGTDTVAVGNSPDPAFDNCSGPSGMAPQYNSQGQEISPVAGEADPYNFVFVYNPSANATSAPIQASLIVGLVSGPAPDRVKVIISDDGLGTKIGQFATNSSTIQGHPLSPNAMAVAAAYYGDTIACGQTANTVEFFSSHGGSAMLFDANGNALPKPYVPNKPDITAPDGITTSFFGYPSFYSLAANAPASCQPGAYANYSFFGTSAAAPHAAGLAALLLQADPSATNGEIYNIMRNTAVHIDPTPGFSFASGNGLVQAQAAKTLLDSIAPAPQSSGGGGGGAFSPLLLLPGLLLARLRRRKRA